MRGKAFGVAVAIAALVGASMLVGHGGALAAGPDLKKTPVKEAPAKAAPTTGKTKNVPTVTDETSLEDAVVVDESDGAIVPTDADNLYEGPSVPLRPSNRVAAPVDLSKPMTEEPNGPPVTFALTGRLSADLGPLASGIVWRVFSEREGADGKLALLTQVEGGAIQVKLAPGSYLVHAAYGRASATKRIVVPAKGGADDFVINAGGLRLKAMVGKDTPIPINQLYFDVYVDDGGDGERTLVLAHAAPQRILRLQAGTYYVVSHYGDGNAQVRAAIKVDAGKLTDATLYHQAARVTLKLVSERGGEALANTAWSVQKPSGEEIGQSVGAYHQAILAAGQYQAVARHDGKTYRATFVVENDTNRDIEVLAK